MSIISNTTASLLNFDERWPNLNLPRRLVIGSLFAHALAAGLVGLNHFYHVFGASAYDQSSAVLFIVSGFFMVMALFWIILETLPPVAYFAVIPILFGGYTVVGLDIGVHVMPALATGVVVMAAVLPKASARLMVFLYVLVTLIFPEHSDQVLNAKFILGTAFNGLVIYYALEELIVARLSDVSSRLRAVRKLTLAAGVSLAMRSLYMFSVGLDDDYVGRGVTVVGVLVLYTLLRRANGITPIISQVAIGLAFTLFAFGLKQGGLDAMNSAPLYITAAFLLLPTRQALVMGALIVAASIYAMVHWIQGEELTLAIHTLAGGLLFLLVIHRVFVTLISQRALLTNLTSRFIAGLLFRFAILGTILYLANGPILLAYPDLLNPNNGMAWSWLSINVGLALFVSWLLMDAAETFAQMELYTDQLLLEREMARAGAVSAKQGTVSTPFDDLNQEYPKEFKALLGLPSETLFNHKKFVESCHIIDRETVESEFRDFYERVKAGNTRARTHFIARANPTGGDFVWYEAFLSAYEKGDRIYLLTSVRDISDLKASEQDLARTLEAKTQALKELERQKQQEHRLFAVICHELRTPLAALRLLLSDKESLDADLRDTQLSMTADQLESAIEDLSVAINPDKPIVLRVAPFKLSSIIGLAQYQVRSLLASDGFSLELEDGVPDSIEVNGDSGRILMMLTNLLRNAILHSGGSEIWLSQHLVGSDEIKGSVTVEWRVSDNGNGIPAADIDRLWAPFERGNSKSDGTGIGLHVVQSTCRAMAGEVHYEPSEEGGACFVIRLPLQLAKEKSTLTADNRYAELNWNVLLVEDSPVIRLMTANLLKKMGFTVTEAYDGTNGLDQFKSGDFDLIVCDYFMPNLDGAEMTHEIRSMGAKLPIIAVTAATLGEEADILRDAGVDHVLPKPLVVNEFILAVDKFAATELQDAKQEQ